MRKHKETWRLNQIMLSYSKFFKKSKLTIGIKKSTTWSKPNKNVVKIVR